jgi:hypothetical protein
LQQTAAPATVVVVVDELGPVDVVEVVGAVVVVGPGWMPAASAAMKSST